MAYLQREVVKLEVRCSCGTVGNFVGNRDEVRRLTKRLSPLHDPHEISAKLIRPVDGDRYFHEDCQPSDPTAVLKRLTEDELDGAIAANPELRCDFCGDPITDDDD